MGWPKGKPRRAVHKTHTHDGDLSQQEESQERALCDGEIRNTERGAVMGVTVKEPMFADIRTDDPRIREAVQNMEKRGYSKDSMVEVIGMPLEVIDKHLRAIKK